MASRDGIAAAMEQCGAAIAVGTFGFIQCFDSAVVWMDNHYRAITAISALTGAMVSVFGMMLSWYFRRQRLQLALKEDPEDDQ